MKLSKDLEFIKLIPNYEKFAKVESVGGGWSSDLKFKVTTIDNNFYLLRVSDITMKNKKQSEFEILKNLRNLSINYSKPILFGEIPEYDKVYMLLDWMSGENVELMIPKLSKEKQYECGYKAGEILRKLHTLPSKLSCEDWKNKNIKKLQERVNIYKNSCNYEIKYFDTIISFINNNLDLLNNRKLTFLHGDYQGRNIVIDENCNVGVIDFERTSFGDPWEEFNRMMTYTRRWSIDFCVGQIDGYFKDEEIPSDFWKVVAFHCALNLLTTIIFGVSTNQKHIYEENEIAKEVIYNDFKGFTTFTPDWYCRKQ